MTAAPPLLQARQLGKRYRLPRRSLLGGGADILALDDISFSLMPGQTLGIVGESGSGKSTLARLAMALEPPSAGQILFRGQDLNALASDELRRLRAGFQMVFQDPFGSFDPRQPVWRSVAEPLEADARISRSQRIERAAEALAEVGLSRADLNRYPHEFSGGQRQRMALARALISRPALIVADEPVSALDVSVQAQVLNLMQDLQERHGLSYLLISHDLAVIDLMADEVIVLQSGRVVERGPVKTVFGAPRHPYTQKLLAAVPAAGRPAPNAQKLPVGSNAA